MQNKTKDQDTEIAKDPIQSWKMSVFPQENTCTKIKLHRIRTNQCYIQKYENKDKTEFLNKGRPTVEKNVKYAESQKHLYKSPPTHFAIIIIT